MSDNVDAPPLMRRSTIVRRRHLEGARIATEQREALKPNRKSLIYSFANIVICSFLWYGATYYGQQNPDCKADFAWQLAIAAWILSSYDVIVRMYIQCKYRRARFIGNAIEEIQIYTVLHSFVYLLGVTIWWYWSQIITWPESSSACADSNYTWQYIAYIYYIMTIVFVGFAAVACTLIVALICCCLPCIIAAFNEIRAEQARSQGQGEGQTEKDDVINGLIKRVYNPNEYTATNECAICFCEFEEDDMITPLPCNVRHYFHAECLEKWMQEKTQCPLCREEINAEDLAKYSETVDNVVKEYAESHPFKNEDDDDQFYNANKV